MLWNALYSAGAVADNVIMKWTGSTLQITLLCVSIVAFILFFLLVYFAAQSLVADMEVEQQRIIAEWRAQRKEGGGSNNDGESDGADSSSASSSADDQLRHRSNGETQSLLSS